MINYVSNLPRDLRSGGFSAMNAAACAALEQVYDTHYVGPISLISDFDQKAVSKLRRIVRLPGSFHQYSERRLAAIARDVNRACDPSARLDFFHGFTPWGASKPPRPYVAWSDCIFRDYLTIYHRLADFAERDVARIEAAEAAWLSSARRIAFTTRWAADNAVRDYGLDPSRVHVVGIFGEVAPPERDAYDGGTDFAFVSTNFEAKGGLVVVAALRQVRARWPEARLVVIGDAPRAIAEEPGISLTGFLLKEDPEQNRRFREILSRVRAVVHPTRSDIAPLLLVEAALFGCPVVASRRFAIPEIVHDGLTGLLIDDPTDAEAVAAAMASLLEYDDKYRIMRRAAWEKSHSELSKFLFESRLLEFVEAAFAEVSA